MHGSTARNRNFSFSLNADNKEVHGVDKKNGAIPGMSKKKSIRAFSLSRAAML